MTKTNKLEIRCNCDPDQPEMVVHLVNGIIPIIIIKCEICEAAYTVMPNSVQHAQLPVPMRSMRRRARDESPGKHTRRQRTLMLQLPNDARVQCAIDHI